MIILGWEGEAEGGGAGCEEVKHRKKKQGTIGFGVEWDH